MPPIIHQLASQGLVLDQITIQFGGLKALDAVSFKVAPGEFVGIVGPNGAGKSTLIQTITGFARPTSGAVRFNGLRLDGRAPETIASFGIQRTFQTSRVFPALTIGESVRVGTQRALIGGGRTKSRFGGLAEPLAALLGLPSYSAAKREAEARTEATLKLFGDRLWPRRDQPAHSLSYANRRRLDIARALAAQPDLLLLDEPTAGMNPTESHELADLLIELRRSFPAMAIVMIEHKLDIVERLAERAIVMGHGKVIVDDTPARAFGHAEVTAAYLGSASGRPVVQIGAGHLQHGSGEETRAAWTGPAIELKNVDVFYGSVQALFGVSLTVGRGEAVAVLGGNASGKSTTIKSVLRLVQPRTGSVELFGTPLPARSTSGVIDLGVASIPEGRRMFAELTLRDNILMGAFPRRREDRNAITDDLDRVIAEFPWMAKRINQLAGTLSGGEQQMVALARAWMRRPAILLIDEPSMGLSPRMVDEVYAILARWKAQGLTILMVEQSANHALALVDRAYVLRSGAVVLEGNAASLRNDPAIREAYLGVRQKMEMTSPAILTAPPRAVHSH